MEVKDINAITTAEEARQEAIDWQNWMSENNVSYGELSSWSGYFTTLANKFDLIDEFKENGII